MILSGSQVSGSYSTTPRSANKATLIEWIPGCGLSMPSIDYPRQTSTMRNRALCIALTSTHDPQVIPSILSSHFSILAPLPSRGSSFERGRPNFPDVGVIGSLDQRLVNVADMADMATWPDVALVWRGGGKSSACQPVEIEEWFGPQRRDE